MNAERIKYYDDIFKNNIILTYIGLQSPEFYILKTSSKIIAIRLPIKKISERDVAEIEQIIGISENFVNL